MVAVEDVTTPLRLVIVDDDPLVRTGLGLILGGQSDLTVVGEASNGQEGLLAVHELKPDIVLMDIRMPIMDGLVATEALAKRPGAPKIIVLTTFDTDDLVLRALQSGASGFLLKDTPPAKMVEAIRAVAEGDPILSPSVTAQLIAAATRGMGNDRRAAALADLEALTEREREVAVAIGQGKSNAEISAELYMSVATVKAYVTRLFDKLAVDNRVQVAMRVHDAGLLD